MRPAPSLRSAAIFAGMLACAASMLRCGEFGEATAVPSEGGAGDASGLDGGVETTPCPPGIDFASDPQHCGRCNRNCGGGACESGTCRSYVIADSTPRPWYIAVDDDPDGDVYWTSFATTNPALAGGDGAVRRVAKKGGGQPAIVALAVGSVFDVAVLGDRVVFTSLDGPVRSVPKAGGPPTILWTGNGASDLARHGASVFFTGFEASLGGVYEIAGGVVTRRASYSASYSPEGVGADDAYVFWANHNGNTTATDPAGASVGRLRRDGMDTVVEWAPNQHSARRIAVGGGYVYWTSDYAGTVQRRLVTGGPVEPFFAGQIRYGTVLIDVANDIAYITDELGNRLVRAGLASGAPQVDLETGLDNPLGIAQDATAIYFTERNGNRIRRMVK